MKTTWMAVGIATSLLLGRTARADLLIDTGPGGTSSIGAQSLFANAAHFQSLAGKFTLSSPATLDSVQGWMGPFGNGGPIDVKIRADGTVPGTAIYSKNYTLGTRISAGWDVFGAFSVTLPAGTYWLSFEPVSNGGMNYSMPGGAATPLAKYAYLADGNPGWVAYGASPTLGMRVSGGPVVVSPQGSASREIFQAPDGDVDYLNGGDNAVESYYGRISLNGYGWSMARGALYANGVAVGAEAVSSQSNAASRAVAWRTFQNTTAGILTFRANAVLMGEFDPSSANFVQATGAIHALDANGFAAAVAASGLPAQQFLLGGNAVDPVNGAANRPNLSALFPAAARLANTVDVINYVSGYQTITLQTPVFSVSPNQTFTLLYDVSALSRGPAFGGVYFLDTLEPAPVPFTDAGGNAVNGIAALGSGISVGEATLLNWDDLQSLSWRPALGADTYRVYTGTRADLPALLTTGVDSCLSYQDVDTGSSVFTSTPPAGQFFWYLAVGLTGSTEGSAGDASAGPRVVNSSGSCP